MADVKISELTALASASVDASGDVLAVVDTSATATRKITVENLLSPITINKATDVITDLGSVTTCDINGGTIDGAAIGGASASTGAFTTLTTTDNLTIDANNKGLILGADQDAMLYSEEGGQIVFATGGTGSVGTNNGYMQLNIGGNNADTTLDIRGGNGSGKSILRMAESTGDENDDHYKFVVDGGSFTIESYSTGSWANMCLFDGSANTQRFFGSVTIDGTVILADDLKFGNNPTSFYMDTSDGNDDKKIQMCGGGGVGTDRGATIIMHGNEISNNEGCLDLKAGYKSDEGDIRFFTGNNSQQMTLSYEGRLGVGDSTPTSGKLCINSGDGSNTVKQADHTALIIDDIWGWQLLGTDGDVGLGQYKVQAGTGHWMYKQGRGHDNSNDFHKWYTADTERFSIASGGIITAGGHLLAGGAFIPGTTTEVDAQKIYDQSSGSGSNTLYIGNQTITTSSDRRIKKNIKDTKINATETLNQLRVVDFEWDDPTDVVWNNKNARVSQGGQWTGLVAQEAVEVVPHIINAPRIEETLEIDEDSEQRWNIQYEHLVPTLIKAIQELTAKVEALEAK